MGNLVTLGDLKKHNTKSDCWIAVHSKVWDITDFISEHPGGPAGKWRATPLETRLSDIQSC